MVSIKRNMGLLFINCMMFVFFMGLSCLAMACPSGQAECCKGTTMSCCPHPGYDSKGLELSYDLSACMTISPINPDGPIVIEPDDPIIPIVKECTIGQVQYKPKGDCGTSERTCCSGGAWSGWDAVCPTTKTCSASSKPTCSLTGGTCSYICTCNTSTGEWENCQKRQRCNVGYESVTVSNGICCQKSDGTGPRCASIGDIGIGYRWVAAGTNCWDKTECGFGCPSNLSDGLACSESEKGNWCSKWDYSVTDVGCDGQFKYRNGQGMCRQYYCR